MYALPPQQKTGERTVVERFISVAAGKEGMREGMRRKEGRKKERKAREGRKGRDEKGKEDINKCE
jgi:hypothetical protein